MTTPTPPLRLHAVRGATTLTHDDDPGLYHRELIRLMDALIAQNDLSPDLIVTLFFSVTDDLHCDNPARIVREQYDWSGVAMLCNRELDVTGMPGRCVRVLVQFYANSEPFTTRPVYLNEAANLRRDLSTSSIPPES